MISWLKKYFLILFTLSGLFNSVSAGSIDLRGTWLFEVGDDSSRCKVEFSDSLWNYIGVPQIWETAGYANYDGYAWYRKTFLIPESWQLDEFVQLQNVLILELGQIDEVEQTFFNGHLIGQTGSFPPDFQAPQKTIRQYNIPTETIRWGEENVIAIRVYDAEGSGGFYAGKPRLRTPSIIDFCDIEFELDQEKHVYQMGQPIYAWVTIKNNADKQLNATLELNLKSVRGPFVDNDLQDVEILPGKSERNRFRLRARIPDFYQLIFRILQVGEILYETHYNIGYNLKRLKAVPNAEDDFDEFWRRTRRQLDLIPVQAKIERIDSLEIPGRHVFHVRLLSFDDVYIYGWYLVPKGRGNFPTILNIHNRDFISGFKQQFSDFALFLLDIRGFGKSRDEINPGNPGYFVWHITNREKYYSRGAIADCIRAVDFLTSRSEVDTARLAVVGNGLGGGLALATAALDSRVKAVAVDSPLLMAYDIVTRLSAVTYHEIVQYLIEHPSEKKNIFKTLSYFDLINLAPSIRAPVLMSVMLADRVSPPISAAVVYNRIPGDKVQKIYPCAVHGYTSTAHEVMKAEWIKQQLNLD